MCDGLGPDYSVYVAFFVAGGVASIRWYGVAYARDEHLVTVGSSSSALVCE
jgi:hypothetical protein